MGNSESGVEPSHSHFRFFFPDNSKVASMMAAVLKPSPDRTCQNPVFCLMAGMDSEMRWSRPLAFVVLAGFGGGLIAAGVLYFLYSLLVVEREGRAANSPAGNEK